LQVVDPPAVSSDVYDTDYFLHAAAGYEAWSSSDGRELDHRYAGSLRIAELQRGETVIDLGCGRGELLVAALAAGAGRAIGVEYSLDGVALARRTLATQGAAERAELVHADIRAVPLPDGDADLVTMLDVVEHLTPTELEQTLREARRLLRPGGRILIHTLPNRLIYDVTYALQRRLPGRRTWPRDPRNDYERAMHVGEQTVGSLGRALRRGGFEHVRAWPGEWVHDEFVPATRPRRLYRRLAAHRLTRRLGAADIWARGANP
jgi:ubiquinone/menaquinone biosynthesis C-methylase UbiE